MALSAFSDATVLLVVRGESGRFGAPMKPQVAQTLYDAVRREGEYDVFPRAALEEAGCHLPKWEDAVRRGGIKFSDGEYRVPVDPPNEEGLSPFMAKLNEWRDPEWHASLHAKIIQLPANQR